MGRYGKVRLILYIALLGMFAAGSPAAETGREETIYTVGIVPQFEIRRLHRIWRPILDELERRTGHRLQMIGSPTIQDFEQESLAGSFDFSYMNPYHVVLASEQTGYIPLVRDEGRALYGVLVVKAGSGIEQITDLQGEVVAFPAPNALGASLQMRQELTDKFGIDFKPSYVKSHDSVYLNVALGQAAAGGGVQKTLERQKASLRMRLEVIHSTTPVSPHPFAAHPRVPERVRREVKQALLDIGTTAEGRQLLAKVPIERIGIASMADYEPLRKQGLERFYQEGR